MGSKLIPAVTAAIGVSLAAAACGSAAPPQVRLDSAGAAHGVIPANRAVQGPGDARLPLAARIRAARAAALRPVGPECSTLPARGLGRADFAAVPAGTAIARSPRLSELAHALQVTGLIRILNSARDLTVFAADNGAFGNVGAGNVRVLLATKPDLIRMLKFQFVAGRVTPAQLGRGRVLTTLGGTKIYPSRASVSYVVNNAWVRCGNLRTANAVVYIVNKVIVPST